VRFTTNLSANSIQLSCKQFLSKYQPPCAAVKSTPLVLLVNSSCKMYACLSLPICHDTGKICSSDKFWTKEGSCSSNARAHVTLKWQGLAQGSHSSNARARVCKKRDACSLVKLSSKWMRSFVHYSTSYWLVFIATIFDSGIPKFQISQTRVSQFSQSRVLVSTGPVP